MAEVIIYIGSLTTSVVSHEFVAVLEQTPGDAASHVTDADKAKSGFFVGECVHFTHS
jgi:hypothetical protein